MRHSSRKLCVLARGAAIIVIAATLGSRPAAAYANSTFPPARTGPSPAFRDSAAARSYPFHTKIVSTTFWVGEIFNPNLPDGSQVCSTYDSQWAYHWSGVNEGRVPRNAPGCPGSIKEAATALAAAMARSVKLRSEPPQTTTSPRAGRSRSKIRSTSIYPMMILMTGSGSRSAARHPLGQ